MIMNNKEQVNKQTPDPTAEIQAAIDTINEFNQQQEAAEKAQFSDIVRIIIHRFSESREKDKLEIQSKLQAAVNILKQHFSLWPKLEEGSEHEKHLAFFAKEVIGRFNSRLDRWKAKASMSAKEKITIFLAEHHEWLQTIDKIELPLNQRRILDVGEKNEEPSVGESSAPSFLLEASHKVSKINFIQSFTGAGLRQKIPHLSTQAAQLFYMKMIALIESHLKVSHCEARQLAADAVVDSHVDPQTGFCFVSGMMDRGSLQITVSGAFAKDPKTSMYNIPSKEIPFELNTHLVQED